MGDIGYSEGFCGFLKLIEAEACRESASIASNLCPSKLQIKSDVAIGQIFKFKFVWKQNRVCAVNG